MTQSMFISSATIVFPSFLLLACGGTPQATPETKSPAPAQAEAPAPAAPVSATTTSAETRGETTPLAAPSDPMLEGLSGEDLEWAQKCLGGNGPYCTRFGNRAEAKTDYPKAHQWYAKGCDGAKKDPLCCMGVGRLTIQGLGTAADTEKGLKMWSATCSMELGRDACGELAKAYEKGEHGLKKDAKKAKEFFAKACDLRDLTACKKAGKKPPTP